MFPSEREFRGVVIECRALPLSGVVTRFTRLREPRMGWILRILIIRHVTRRTRRAQRRELIVHVTRRARDRRMLARQRELRCVVIERRPGPLRRRVARFARLRETRRRVIRTRRLLEVQQVT
jgi:hypothetical protein